MANKPEKACNFGGLYFASIPLKDTLPRNTKKAISLRYPTIIPCSNGRPSIAFITSLTYIQDVHRFSKRQKVEVRIGQVQGQVVVAYGKSGGTHSLRHAARTSRGRSYDAGPFRPVGLQPEHPDQLLVLVHLDPAHAERAAIPGRQFLSSGPSVLHDPHQLAEKSSSTGVLSEACSTPVSKVAGSASNTCAWLVTAFTRFSMGLESRFGTPPSLSRAGIKTMQTTCDRNNFQREGPGLARIHR